MYKKKIPPGERMRKEIGKIREGKGIGMEEDFMKSGVEQKSLRSFSLKKLSRVGIRSRKLQN